MAFLEVDPADDSSNGFMLLETLRLLSMGSPDLVEAMSAAALPSTLVKCLYLFFDLPEAQPESGGAEGGGGKKLNAGDRRTLLQRSFGEVRRAIRERRWLNDKLSFSLIERRAIFGWKAVKAFSEAVKAFSVMLT